MLLAWQLKAMNIQYHVIIAAAHIESLGKMRQEHSLLVFCGESQAVT